MLMEFIETIHAYGHPNILATHPTTFEVTKDEHVTRRGNCIIAALADRSPVDLGREFKEAILIENAKVTISIKADDIVEIVHAFGSSKLILSHPTEMVVRKSNYFSNRTIAVRSDKAACDLSRSLVKKLQSCKQKVEITINVNA